MNTRKTLAIGSVAGGCLLGIIYGIFTSGNLIISWLGLTTEIVYPPSFPELLAILVLLSLLTVTCSVAMWQTLRSTSAQAAMASGWFPGSILLWIMVWGWVLLVYHPIPYRGHHIGKVLLGLASLLLWSLLYVLAPGQLAALLKGRLFHWFTLALVNVLIFVVAGEAVLRLADPWLARRGPFGSKQTPSFMTPHARVDGSIGFTNSLGFRDREWTVGRTTSAPRVIAIGDSFTHGGLSYDEVFVTRLERALQQRTPGAEILNMGVPGWGPPEELELLKSTAIHFNPDLVLLNVYVGNDIIEDAHFEPAMVVGGHRYRGHVRGNWVHDHLGPQRWYLYHHINYLITMGPSRVRQALALGAGKPMARRTSFHSIDGFCGLYGRETTKYFLDYWGQARESLEAMVRLLHSQGVDVLLVLHPDAEQLYEWTGRWPCSRGTGADQYDFERPQRFLREWSAMNRVPVIDLLPTFQGVAQPAALYGENDFHYSAEGHRLAAMTIQPILRDRVVHLNSHLVQGKPWRMSSHFNLRLAPSVGSTAVTDEPSHIHR